MKLKHTRTSRYKGLLRLDGNRNKPGVLRSAKAGEARRGREERVFQNGHRLDFLNILEENTIARSLYRNQTIFLQGIYLSQILLVATISA